MPCMIDQKPPNMGEVISYIFPVAIGIGAGNVICFVIKKSDVNLLQKN